MLKKRIFNALKDSKLVNSPLVRSTQNIRSWMIKKYQCLKWAKYDGGIVQLPTFKMYVDPMEAVISKSIYLHKEWEPFETKLFISNISKGDVIVDVGAHIGWYSLLASTQTGTSGKVYAFEPEPRSFNILLKNIKLNNISNIVPVQRALSDSVCTTKLYKNLYKNGPSNYQMWPTSDEKSILIKTITLDAFLSNKKLDVMKIDVEGYEVKVFKGAKKVLSENPNLVIFSEFWPEGLRKAGNSPKEYLQIITKHGFNIQKIEQGILKRINYAEALDIQYCTNFRLSKTLD